MPFAPGLRLRDCRLVRCQAAGASGGGRVAEGMSFGRGLLVRALALVVLCGGARLAFAGGVPVMSVGGAGGKFTTIQAAVDAAPAGGAEIRIAPGTYREVVHVDKAGIHFRGQTKDPAKVMLVYGNSAGSTCGTGCSGTLFVNGDDFIATYMTIANDYSKRNPTPSQAVALMLRGDRAVLRKVRLLGAQDTLYAASRRCKVPQEPCSEARQYFKDCYIEGHVDFIFGDAKAFFEGCEIRSIAHGEGGYVTAQSRLFPAEDSAYVFDHCRLMAEAGAGPVYLGRPWRDYSTVVFLHTEMGAHIRPEGWSTWKDSPTERLNTATYAEYGSKGPGGDVSKREPMSRQLTKEQAKAYEVKTFMRGKDGWDPEKVQ